MYTWYIRKIYILVHREEIGRTPQAGTRYTVAQRADPIGESLGDTVLRTASVTLVLPRGAVFV